MWSGYLLTAPKTTECPVPTSVENIVYVMYPSIVHLPYALCNETFYVTRLLESVYELRQLERTNHGVNSQESDKERGVVKFFGLEFQ